MIDKQQCCAGSVNAGHLGSFFLLLNIHLCEYSYFTRFRDNLQDLLLSPSCGFTKLRQSGLAANALSL